MLVRTLEFFQGTHILGPWRGRLCDSSVFLLTLCLRGGKEQTCLLPSLIFLCFSFSRSYCSHIARRVIDSWHDTFVCPSVCLSVALCIVSLGVGIEGRKLYQRVLIAQLSVHFLREFCCRMCCLAEKHSDCQHSAKKKLTGNTTIG